MAGKRIALEGLPSDSRPREKLLQRGPAALSDAELLALLLRTGIQGKNVLLLAQELVDSFGGVAGLLHSGADELGRIKGLGPAKRAELLAVVEGGAIKASGINQARTEGRCQQPGGSEESWRAAGNEPGWLLAVGNEVVAVKRPGKPDLRLPFTPPQRAGGVTHLEATGDGNRLSASFEKRLCHDTMADSVFGWTATVNLNGQTLKGCAWQR